jgi:hypothetical protein
MLIANICTNREKVSRVGKMEMSIVVLLNNVNVSTLFAKKQLTVSI